MTNKKTTGDIAMTDGSVFRWMLQGDRIPEIYGWIERDHAIVPKTGGFWRTDDPEVAAQRAADAFGLTVKGDDTAR